MLTMIFIYFIYWHMICTTTKSYRCISLNTNFILLGLYLAYSMRCKNTICSFLLQTWETFITVDIILYIVVFINTFMFIPCHFFIFFPAWQSCTHFSRLFWIYVCYQDHKKKCQQPCLKILINVDVTFLWLTVKKLTYKITRS